MISNKITCTWAAALLLALASPARAGEIDEKAVVQPAQPKQWRTFPLRETRLQPASPFYQAMVTSQKFLLDTDLELMLNPERRAAGLPEVTTPYPGSHQPAGTRPNYLPHYLSAVSLMYAQTGDPRYKERSDCLVRVEQECAAATQARAAAGQKTRLDRLKRKYDSILAGKLTLDGPDETGFPWGGPGNFYYSIHKDLAALRDAYLYCDNPAALALLKAEAEPHVQFALQANPDLFDDLLDIEHGGMNEVMADLYALTGDKRYLAVSLKFNHQKVILPLALGQDPLYGRHVNMQVPTLVGTARQYQLTGDEVAHKATANFLDIMYRDYTSAIGGSGRCERYNRPGEITKSLGYSADETCATYNMLKVALNEFESTGELRHLDYFERGLYNHILASQDPASGGVTYYTSLMPGGFKAYSDGFNLKGVWCCVGTGMENHAKYGEGIFLHNAQGDLLVNLFTASTLDWQEKGLKLVLDTRFPEADVVTLKVLENKSFKQTISLRYPSWASRPVRVWRNGQPVAITAKPGELIQLGSNWQAGDEIKIDLPQDFRLEPAPDDPHTAAIMRGPLVMAGGLGAARLPGSDQIPDALPIYNNWVPPTDDIPVLVVNKTDFNSWLKPVAGQPLTFRTVRAGRLPASGKAADLTLKPYYLTRHEREVVYFKLFSPQEMTRRQAAVSDELNPADAGAEKAHGLQGDKTLTSTLKDERHFWENNRPGRKATDGGWFAYKLKLRPADAAPHYLVVTYWGSEASNHDFDVVVDGQPIQTEHLADRHPLTYYEQVYALPTALTQGKKSVTVRFQAKPGASAGAVYGLKLTTDPQTPADYLFY